MSRNHSIHIVRPYMDEEMRSDNDNEQEPIYRDHWSFGPIMLGTIILFAFVFLYCVIGPTLHHIAVTPL